MAVRYVVLLALLASAQFVFGQANVNSGAAGSFVRPPIMDLASTASGITGKGRRSVGGVRDLALSEPSITVRIPIESADRKSLREIASTASTRSYASFQVVLDRIHLQPQGRLGGYFYKLYLNLHQQSSVADLDKRFIGTIGPFEIAAASQQGSAGRIVLPATDALRNIKNDEFQELTVSLVRVNGDKAPPGVIMSIGEIRLEMSRSVSGN